MSESPHEPAQSMELSFEAKWDYDLRAAPALVNQVLIQHAMPDGNLGIPGGMYIRLGHVNPPLLQADMTAEEASKSPLPVVIAGHYYMPLATVVALRDSLNEALRNAGMGS